MNLENVPKNTQKLPPYHADLTSPVSPPRQTHDPLQNSPLWEKDVMRERRHCGERNEMRNKQEHKVRERESENVNTKILYVLELCYNAILPLELHCSSIIKKFVVLGFCIPWCWALWGLKCQILLTFGICIPSTDALMDHVCILI